MIRTENRRKVLKLSSSGNNLFCEISCNSQASEFLSGIIRKRSNNMKVMNKFNNTIYLMLFVIEILIIIGVAYWILHLVNTVAEFLLNNNTVAVGS